MPFMALMAAPLSAMLSVTGGDGSLDYPSHTRARNADNRFWRHHVSPRRPREGVRFCRKSILNRGGGVSLRACSS